MPLPIDNVAHIRESLRSWIDNAPEDVIRALLKVRRNLDANIKKPAAPAGWRSLAAVATEKNICPGHLARLCRDIYGAQELARKCLHQGRETWCLSPECITQLRANQAPSESIPDLGPLPNPAAPTTRQADTALAPELRKQSWIGSSV